MAHSPPSALYDRIECAPNLTDYEKAELTAFAEEFYHHLAIRATQAEILATQRAFWSLVASWHHWKPVNASSDPGGIAGLDKVKEIEDRLGIQLIGSASRFAMADLDNVIIEENVLGLAPKSLAKSVHGMPFKLAGSELSWVLSDPEDRSAFIHIHKATAKRTKPHSASIKDIERAQNRWYPLPSEESAKYLEPEVLSFDPFAIEEEEFDVEFALMHPTETLAAGFVGRSLASGYRNISIEPFENFVLISGFDSDWNTLEQIPRNLWEPLQLCYRHMTHTAFLPYNNEAAMDWPFMNATYRVHFQWTQGKERKGLMISLFGVEDDEPEEPSG